MHISACIIYSAFNDQHRLHRLHPLRVTTQFWIQFWYNKKYMHCTIETRSLEARPDGFGPSFLFNCIDLKNITNQSPNPATISPMENMDFCVKWEPNEDYFSTLVLMRTKSSIEDISDVVVHWTLYILHCYTALHTVNCVAVECTAHYSQ